METTSLASTAHGDLTQGNDSNKPNNDSLSLLDVMQTNQQPKLTAGENDSASLQAMQSNDDASSRFLAEFVADSAKGRPHGDVSLDAPQPPAEAKVEVKPDAVELAKKAADKFKADALKELGELHHRTISFNAAGHTLAPSDSYHTQPSATPLQIAAEKLGGTTDRKELQLFAAQIVKINHLGVEAGKAQSDADVAAQTSKPIGDVNSLRLPGVSDDGAVVVRNVDQTTKYWTDGTKVEESEKGGGSATYKDANGFKVTTKWNPDSVDGSTKLKETPTTRSERTGTGVLLESEKRIEKVKDKKTGKESEEEHWDQRRISMTDDKSRSMILEYGPGPKSELQTVLLNDGTNKVEVHKIGENQFAGTKRTQDDEIVDTNYRMNLVNTSSGTIDLSWLLMHPKHARAADAPEPQKLWWEKLDGGKSHTNGDMQFFSRKDIPGGTEDTFQDGGIERRNADGKLTYEKFSDDWNRPVERIYGDPPQPLPETIVVQTKDHGALQFKQGDFGDYWGKADFKPADGPEIKDAKIHRNAAGLVVFYKGNGESWAENKDGTMMHKTTIMNNFQGDANVSPELKERLLGGQKVTMTKDGQSMVQYFDNQGNRARDVYAAPKDSPVSEVVRDFLSDGKSFANIHVKLKTGENLTLGFDRKTGMFRDTEVTATSQNMSKAYYLNDKLILTAPNSADYREIDVPLRASNQIGGKQNEGKYDHQVGTIATPQKDGSTLVESLSPGREDTVQTTGKISGKTVLGERSTVDPGKETVLFNRDGSKLQFLPAESKVNYWGQTGEPTGSDSLSPEEKKYYSEQPDLQKDPRDFAELHRAYVGRENELKSVYVALQGFETSLTKAVADKKLTPPEASALRKDILHDLSHPEDIDQEQMGTCNVEVVRREMALNTPARYVTTFDNALNDKAVIAKSSDLVSGPYSAAKSFSQTLKLNFNELKMDDSTGRNLAARIFDNTALEVGCYDQKTHWHPTPDGVGAYIPEDPNQNQEPFNGMEMGQIADVVTKMTGVKRSVINIESPEDLEAAFHANGGRSAIIAVDAKGGPISSSGRARGQFTNHVITLVGIDAKNDKVWFENNWGPKFDHSSVGTTASAKSLVNNMVSTTGIKETIHREDRSINWKTAVKTIGPGEPGQVYRVSKDGKIELEPRFFLNEDGREVLK